jgi:hypothetical protein
LLRGADAGHPVEGALDAFVGARDGIPRRQVAVERLRVEKLAQHGF